MIGVYPILEWCPFAVHALVRASRSIVLKPDEPPPIIASTVNPEEDMSGDSNPQSPCCSLRYSSFVALLYFPPQSSIEIQVQDDQMSISFLGHCNTFTDLPYFSPLARAPSSSTIVAQSTQGSHEMMLHSDSKEDAYRVDVS